MGLGSISSVGTTQAPREASMSHAIEQFDPITKQLHETRDRLEQILNRVFGPHPTGVNENQEQGQVPSSMIGNLNIKARHVARLAEEIGALTNRLDLLL